MLNLQQHLLKCDDGAGICRCFTSINLSPSPFSRLRIQQQRGRSQRHHCLRYLVTSEIIPQPAQPSSIRRSTSYIKTVTLGRGLKERWWCEGAVEVFIMVRQLTLARGQFRNTVRHFCPHGGGDDEGG